MNRLVVLVAALLLSVLSVAQMARGSTPGDAAAPERVHVVEAGETLWSIARAEVGAEGDPRPLIERIRAENALASPDIVAGQELAIPG